MNEFETILIQIKQHQDDLEWLSKTCIDLAGLLFTHNTQIAQAELTETKVAIDLIDCSLDPSDNKKKLSVAEAEKRAVVQTGNKYGEMKKQGEAVLEVINSLKVRIKVLTLEKEVLAKEST